MRKALFIAHYFPPIGGSGVQRPTKFVKYLPQFGWQPYVIATNRPYGEEGWDETLLADVPSEVQVWRVPTPHPQPVNQLARLVGWKPTAPDPIAATEADGARPTTKQRPSVVKTIRRTVLSPLYLAQKPPIDDQIYWSLSRIL